MYPEVIAEFKREIPHPEGFVRYMYLDHVGKVTIGIGNLLDEDSAADLPFVHKVSGIGAGAAAVREEFRMVSRHRELIGASATAFAGLTTLRLTDAAVGRLLDRKIPQYEASLRQSPYFNQVDSWPADAQLGVLIMVYGLGIGKLTGFHDFRAACQAQDWRRAAEESHWRHQRAERTQALQRCFNNAAIVTTFGHSYNILYSPASIYPYT